MRKELQENKEHKCTGSANTRLYLLSGSDQVGAKSSQIEESEREVFTL